MPHSAPNIPESSPHHVKSETLNGILNAVKGAANTFFGNGVEASSTSSGNSFKVGDNYQKRSFWAMLTRRLRYFNKPPLSFLRITIDERLKKFGKPTTEYDIPGWYDPTTGKWLGDQKFPNNTAVQLWRNPWDSYDGYVREDGKWDEMNISPFYPNSGLKNQYYYQPKEERYVRGGPNKLISLYSTSNSGSTSSFESTLPSFEYYCGYCPQFIWCYGWCELIDSFDLKRVHSPFFLPPKARASRQAEILNMSRHPAPVLTDPDAPPYDPDNNPELIPKFIPFCVEHTIPEEYMSHGGDYGTAMGHNKAHEVNNSRTLVGTIVRMTQGKGNHFLFVNPQCPNRSGGGTGITGAPYHFWAGAYNTLSKW